MAGYGGRQVLKPIPIGTVFWEGKHGVKSPHRKCDQKIYFLGLQNGKSSNKIVITVKTFEQAVQKSTSALNLSPIKYLSGLVHAFLMGLFFVTSH